MRVSVDLSMYPLNESYKDLIISFIKRLRSHSEIEIETNGMSTQLYGDYEVLMPILQKEIKPIFSAKDKVVMVMKMVNDDLSGPIKF